MRNFNSLFMVASCAGAALGCYLVSLRVASERAALEAVETKIVAAQRDMRVLQTEIGTRGRLAQLERWNVKVLALSAPSADQFLQGGFELARLTKPDSPPDFEAPVVLASAPAQEHAQPEIGQRGNDDSGVRPSGRGNSLLHEASLKTETRDLAAQRTVAPAIETPRPVVAKPKAQPVIAVKPARRPSPESAVLASAKQPVAKTAPKPTAKPAVTATGKATAKQTVKTTAKATPKISVDKARTAVAKPVTKPVQIAKNDPLAPLPATRAAKPTKE
jgi:hypothetical protein